MPRRQRPSFRKVVIPWYDSALFCLVISVFMGLIFCFSIVGVGVALEHEEYQGYCWLPLVLTVLSGVVLAANLVRLLTEILKRRIEEE